MPKKLQLVSSFFRYSISTQNPLKKNKHKLNPTGSIKPASKKNDNVLGLLVFDSKI